MSSKNINIKSLQDFINSNYFDCQELSLNFKGRNYDANQAQILAKQIEKYKSLEMLKLDLNSNCIGQEGAIFISQSLTQCKNLRNLIIILSSDSYGFNYISEIGANGLGQGLANFQKLQHLEINLRYNTIGSNGAINLVKQLKNCSNLQQLIFNLKNNSLLDKGAIGLAEGIGECSQLIHLKLYLKYNNIGDQACYGFGIGLSKCRSLERLFVDLSGQDHEYNRIGDMGAIQLGKSLSNCYRLKNLEIKLNQQPINQEGASILFQQLTNAKSLKVLAVHLGFIIPMGYEFTNNQSFRSRYQSRRSVQFLPRQFRCIDNQGVFDMAKQLANSSLFVIKLYFKETINRDQIAILKEMLKKIGTLVDLKVEKN
ncbi:hypothetical protein ABPG74_017060 [Tetrahymena malaccensis]